MAASPGPANAERVQEICDSFATRPLIPFSVIPRRNRLDLNTPAELAIFTAIQAVEEAGAHPLLTEAVVLLGQARDKVADYVDREGGTDGAL